MAANDCIGQTKLHTSEEAVDHQGDYFTPFGKTITRPNPHYHSSRGIGVGPDIITSYTVSMTIWQSFAPLLSCMHCPMERPCGWKDFRQDWLPKQTHFNQKPSSSVKFLFLRPCFTSRVFGCLWTPLGRDWNILWPVWTEKAVYVCLMPGLWKIFRVIIIMMMRGDADVFNPGKMRYFRLLLASLIAYQILTLTRGLCRPGLMVLCTWIIWRSLMKSMSNIRKECS